MPDGIHAGHHGKQDLRGADVARRLLPADVLLACLQSHSQRRRSVGVTRDADDPAGNLALKFVAGRKVRGVGTTVAQRHSKSLRVTHCDVCAPLTGGREQRERQKVGGHRNEGVLSVRSLADVAIVAHCAVGRRVLQENAEHVGSNLRRSDVTNSHGDSAHPGPRLHDVNGLGVTRVGDEKDFLVLVAFYRVAHRHRFRRGRRLVKQRRIGNLQRGEIDHHRLEIEQRLEPALRDLRLVRCICCVPCRILDHVSLDHRGSDAIRVSHPDERPENAVLRRQRPEISQHMPFAPADWKVEAAAIPDLCGNCRVDQLVKRRIPEGREHRHNIFVRWPDVPRDERFRRREGPLGVLDCRCHSDVNLTSHDRPA